MHALMLAAALFTPGSMEDPSILVESCKAQDAACAAYLLGFGSGLNVTTLGTYKEGSVEICLKDGVPVPVEELARNVVRLGTPEMLARPGVSSGALALAALHFAAPCD